MKWFLSYENIYNNLLISICLAKLTSKLIKTDNLVVEKLVIDNLDNCIKNIW